MTVDVKVASERAQARVGFVIKGKWRLDRLLGVGGMAAVYAATHRNKKRAAIKMLHREYSTDPAIRERFLREGYLANSVGHRGVPTVDDDDVAEDGTVFFVMELLDGETLEQRWRRKGQRLPVQEVLAVADQVLDALTAAHQKGVVHRDLKPDNLFLTRDGVVKLLDFGIGRLKELKGVASTTVAGAAMGTPAFMAPEQARGRWDAVDGQTDLWALGAAMFTLLAGGYVHEAQTVNETLAMAATRPARSLASVRPDLPPSVTALIDRALAFDKAKRFADAPAMQAEVRRVFAALAGTDVEHAPQLSLSDAEASSPLSSAATVGPLRAVRGGPALGWATPLRNAWGHPNQRRALLAAGGVALLLSAGLTARACAESPRDAASPFTPPASGASTAMTAAPTPSVERTAAIGSAEPPLSVDQLPREYPGTTLDQHSGAGASAPPRRKAAPARRH